MSFRGIFNRSIELDGLIAIVTRPVGQADELKRLIQQSGGRVVSFPTLEISAITDATRLQQRVAQLDTEDWAIFISVNAVEAGMDLINQADFSLDQIKIISIGRSTTKALENRGVRVDLSCPPPASSESLLATPEMQAVQGRRIYIFKGTGGRRLLGQTLTERGALVEYIECYHRGLPQMDLSVLEPTTSSGAYNVTITTSVDGLRNLIDAVRASEYDHLLRSDLVVIGERQSRAADSLGWKGKVVAVEDASSDLVLVKLKELVNQRAKSR